MIYRKKANKIFLFVLFILFANQETFAQSNYGTKSGKVSFFSSTPVEDIRAVSEKLSAVLVAKTNAIAFQVPIKSFSFAKGLMQEHFNENYLESDKYPYAKFKGKISSGVDWTKDGEYPVTATGILNVHGVDQERQIPGKIVISNGKVKILSNFDVACVDHKIKIPNLIVTKIAEVINVKVDAQLNSL